MLVIIKGKRVAIEILVTHEVDTVKVNRLRRLGLSAVEIDLSNAPREFRILDLVSLVVEGGPHKTWAYNVIAEQRLHTILQSSSRMPTIQRGFARHVDGCPIKARMYKGKPYANVTDDCLGCEHCADVSEEMDFIICSAPTNS